MLLWLIFRLVPPLVVVLVVSRSDLQNGAVEIDPEIASKVCSSLNPDPLQSSLMSDDPESSLEDLVGLMALIQNNNWEISNIYKDRLHVKCAFI